MNINEYVAAKREYRVLIDNKKMDPRAVLLISVKNTQYNSTPGTFVEVGADLASELLAKGTHRFVNPEEHKEHYRLENEKRSASLQHDAVAARAAITQIMKTIAPGTDPEPHVPTASTKHESTEKGSK